MLTVLGDKLFTWYVALVLRRPVATLILLSIVLLAFAYGAKSFRLDVSAESLVLENDADLVYYRSIASRYGSDDYLIVTYTPRADLFNEDSLARLEALRDELAGVERVVSVVSLLDVPLLESPPIAFAELSQGIRTLQSPDVDKVLAEQELRTSELYLNRLMSPDGRTTAIQVNFARDEMFWELLNARNRLRCLLYTSDAADDSKRVLMWVGAG